ncbi:MAG: WYL domain-containing protein [Eubacterium sp.]|nr:WYL domain-containing protein [Eubacterium sp.]
MKKQKTDGGKPLVDRQGRRINEDARYAAERRTIEILKVLQDISDERHPVTQAEIRNRLTTTKNAGTLSKTLDEILQEIQPLVYDPSLEEEYRIRYRGYQEDALIHKLVQDENVDENDRRTVSITNLEYVHPFSYEEMNQLIEAVGLSGMLSKEDKKNLTRKILKTASRHYHTPYYDRDSDDLKFNPYAVSGRFLVRDDDNLRLSENLKKIQTVMNRKEQIRFHFNEYDETAQLQPRNRDYLLSPYYIVVSQDKFYVIGGEDFRDTASHYRVDLMTDVERATDEKGRPLKMLSMSRFRDLPRRDATWDPEKYLSEHLYMGYDLPRRIVVKIRNTDYTVLHDWFGKHYRKLRIPCEAGYDLVEIRTSPSMIVHWAMQYAGTVEIMDEEVREKVREEIKKIRVKYDG